MQSDRRSTEVHVEGEYAMLNHVANLVRDAIHAGRTFTYTGDTSLPFILFSNGSRIYVERHTKH
jgi:hypothetical protein